MRIDFSKVECCRLSDTTTGIDTFENKEKELVDFIQNDALDDQNKKIGTTWTWTYDKNILIGFITLAMFSINKKTYRFGADKYPHRMVPSLLIGQLATHKRYECCGLGREMVHFAMRRARDASQTVGCRCIALHPLPNTVSWYQTKTSFRLIKNGKQCIMYFDMLQKQ